MAVHTVDHARRLVTDDLREPDRVGTPPDLPGDEGVPQQVRVYLALDPGLGGKVADQLLDAGSVSARRCYSAETSLRASTTFAVVALS